ncbi:signal transducer [Moniliophthora roreri]|nr:signal transducer [Moniliophthora roreri]
MTERLKVAMERCNGSVERTFSLNDCLRPQLFLLMTHIPEPWGPLPIEARAKTMYPGSNDWNNAVLQLFV